LHPQILRHLLPTKDAANLRPDDAIDPVHGSTKLSSCKSLSKSLPSLKRGRVGFVPQRRGKPLDEAKHLRLGFARSVAVFTEALGDGGYEGRANHYPFGDARQGAHLPFGLHAEADRNTQIGMRLDAADMRGNRRDVWSRRAGDADDRDIVD